MCKRSFLKGLLPEAEAGAEEGAGENDEEREEREEKEKGSEAVSYVGDGGCLSLARSCCFVVPTFADYYFSSSALKDSPARIVRTFGDRLTAFRFPPRVAGKVQGFMDFCATTI